MDILPLQVEQFGFRFGELERLEVAIHERGNKVKPMILMELAQTINADSLLVIKAEKLQLLAVEGAIYWYRFLSNNTQCR